MEAHLMDGTPQDMAQAGYGVVGWFDKKIVVAFCSQRAVAKFFGVKVHVVMYALKEKKKVAFKGLDVALRIMSREQISLIGEKDITILDERFLKTPYELTKKEE